MEYPSYKCDVCGAVKGMANHWFRASRLPGKWFAIVPWSCSFGSVAGSVTAEQHICGMSCAAKAMHRAMTEGQETERRDLERASPCSTPGPGE